MKSEPGTYSIQDLDGERKKTTHWEGVRNYQARNLMQQMKVGDRVLFYHSNARPPAAVGVCRVIREAYPDFTAFDPFSKYYDPKSKLDSPRWFMVDIQLDAIFPRPVPLDEIKQTRSLAKMVLVNNSRLSVQPVTRKEFETIVKMGQSE